MKKLLSNFLLGLVCLATPYSGISQTILTIGDTAGLSSYFYGPMYRSSAGSSFNYNFYGALFEATELSIPIGTTINSLSWKKSSASTITGGVADFTIRMKNTSATSFGASERYDSLTSATFTTVYSSTTQNILGGVDTWVTFVLTTPFVYTGGSIIISTDWDRDGGTSNGGINWYYEDQAGKAVGFASGSPMTASTTTSGGYSNKRPTVRMNLTYPLGACIPPSGISMSAITSSSAIASWTSGGASNSLVEYGPAGFTLGTGSQMYVAATSASLSSLAANTSYDVYVKDSCVSGASPWIGPTSFTTPCTGPMSGTYTINSGLPSGGTNFNSFTEAASELNSCGISGPVTINVVQGTYNEQITIDLVPGASMANSVLIQPDPSNTMPAVLTYGATGSLDNYVLKLKDAQYVTVQGLTITATGSFYGYTVDFEGSCSNVELNNNTLNGISATSTSSNASVIYNSSSSLDIQNDITIRNNNINNGSYGLYWYGSSATYEMNNSIDSNTIQGFYYYGIYSYYQDGITFNGNTVTQNSTTPYTVGYGIRNYYGDNSEVIGNTITIHSTNSSYGIYNYLCDATSLSPNIIANNMVSCLGSSGTTYGIYAYNNYFTDIVYNSINVNGGSLTAGRAMYLNSSSSGTYGFINLKNNNVVNTGGGYALEISSGAMTLGYVASTDYNNLYATGATVVRVNNSNQASLLAYKAAHPTFDQNSVSANPLFSGLSNLHVSSPTLDGAGDSYTGITIDIDGDVRGVSPDIGADEFTAPTCLPSSGHLATTLYADSAVVSWVAGTGTTFNLQYGLLGFTPGSGMTITGITDTFYTITGISPSTGYDFYIQDDCGAGDTSVFSGPGSFMTLCSTFPAPFTETFTTTTTPNCWSQSATTGGPWVFTGTPDFGSTFPMPDHTNGVTNNYAWMDQSSTDLGVILEMPNVDVSTLTNPYLSYWVVSHTTAVPFTNYNLIYVEAWDGSSWAVVDSVSGEYGLQWVEFRADLSGHTYGANLVKLRFRAESGGESRDYDNDMLLDDVVINNLYDIMCPPMMAPYVENFDSAFTPACWTESATTGGPWRYTGSANSVQCAAPADHTGNGGSYAWMDQSGGDAGVILQMPRIDVSALTTPYLDFYYWMCGTGYSPVNKTFIETFDGTSWSVFDSITTATSGWENKGYDLTSAVYGSNMVQVRFRAESGGSFDDYWGDNSIDDVSIIESPTCFTPSALGAFNVTGNSADIYWTTGGASNWNVEYGLGGFTQGTGTMMAVTNDTVPLASLLPLTTYQFYVQDSCGAGDVSNWTSFTFTTPCAAIVPPSLEDFNTFLPSCWNEAAGGTPLTGPSSLGTGRWTGDGFANAGSSGAAKINMYTTGANDWLLSPQYDLSSGLWNVEFNFGVFNWNGSNPTSLGSDDEVQLLISSDGGGTWTNLATFNSTYVTNAGGNHEIFSLQSYAGSTVQFAIWATEGTVNDPEDNDIFIDSFQVSDFCLHVMAPYTETFDGSTTPHCWSQSAASGGPWRFTGSANSVQCAAPADHTGNGGTYAWMDQSGSDAGVILQMPEVDVSALTVPYLDLFYWMCGVNYSPVNKTYIETYDGSTWSVFDSITTATSGWENIGFDLSSAVYNTDKVQVRFRAESGGSFDDYWGDNSLDDVSIMEAPTCFSPSALGATNITSTSADIYWTTGGASNWNVEYGLSGFTPGTGMMMAAANDTVALPSLGAASDYQFYVQDSCGPGDVSIWAGPFTFSTLCGVIIPPSLQDFNNSFPANCWNEADGGTPATGPTTLGTGAWANDGFMNSGTSGSPKINLYNVGDEDWILSPFYDLTGGPFNAEFDFAVTPWNGTSPGQLGSDDEVQFLVSTDTGATWTSLWTADSGYVTNAGGNHETVSLAAYAGQIVMFAFWATEGTVDDPEDNDIFVDNFEVSDPCAGIMAPYVENFDSASTPTCWSQSTTTGGPWVFSTGPGVNTSFCAGPSDHTGNGGRFAWMDQSSTDAGVILGMPSVNVSALTTPYLSFYYWMCGVGYSPANKLYIETYDGTNWTVFDSIVQATSGWELFGFDLTSAVYNTNLVKVRFRAESGGASSDFYGDNVMDDVGIIEAPTCFPTSALGATNITATSADIFWTTGGATNWNVEYGLAGFTQGTGIMMAATNDTVALSSLNPSSTYEFYVRDSCGPGDVSIWTGPFSFTTLCAPIATFPWLETFEPTMNSIPNCWFNELTDDADWIFRNGSIGHGATSDHTLGTSAGYYAGMDDSQSSPNDTVNNLLTPQFDLTSLTTPRLNFYYYIGNDNVLTSKLFIDVYDGTTWNMAVATINFTQTGWLQQFVDLTPYKSTTTRIRFRGVETTDFNSDISIDDVMIEETPNCPTPTALGVTALGDTTATIFWTTGGASDWNVEYGLVGFTLGTGTMANATNDSLVINGLSSGMTYEFYVRDSCGLADVSQWAGPFAFTTALCPAANACNFTVQLRDGFGDGWNGTEVTVYQNGVAVGVLGSNFTGSTGTPPGDTLVTTLSLCDNMLTEFVISTGTNGFPNYAEEIGIRVSDPGNIHVATYLASPSAAAGDTLMSFTSSCGVASCAPPTALGAFNLGTTSADVFWTTGGASNWNVQYGLSGFPLGSGNTMAATNDTVTLNMLSPSTAYSFYVQDSCGAGNVSTWAGPYTFNTAACPPVNAGMDDSVAVCSLDTAVDLSSYLGTHDTGGTWYDRDNSGGLSGGTLDASMAMAGTYNYDYVVAGTPGCPSDSATIQVTVMASVSAGPDSVATECTNGGNINLSGYVTGATGGTFTNLDTASGVTGNTFDPSAAGPGTYRFSYTVSGGVCPSDTAMVTITLIAAPDAGGAVSDTVCDTLSVDLNSYLGANADTNGTWTDISSTGALTGSIFDASAVANNSSYTFRYTVTNSCGTDSADVTLYVRDCSIGLKELTTGRWNVYPNPTTDVVNIENLNGIGGDMTIELYTIGGKLVSSRVYNAQEIAQVDMSRLPDGVYNVKVTTSETMSVHRVTKQ